MSIKHYFIRLLASLHVPAAENYMGYSCEERAANKIDLENALVWYRRAARQGDAHALANLGRFYEEGIVATPDFAKAIALYKRAAQLNHVWAQNRLGTLLVAEGSQKALTEAVHWFERAATYNDANAKLNLAWVYSEGIGVSRDLAKAYALVEQAANQGLPEAQYTAGLMLVEGNGVSKNWDAGVAWIRKARDAGHIEACRFFD